MFHCCFLASNWSWYQFIPSFFLNQRIIDLQCYVSFCCTTKRISYKYTYIPSLLNLPALPSYLSRSSQRTCQVLESLFGGSSRGAQLLLYPWPKTGPPLSGMVVLFDWVCSFGRDAHGAVREEGDTRLASQISWINPGDQWGDRCPNQIALTPTCQVLDANCILILWGFCPNSEQQEMPLPISHIYTSSWEENL